MNAAALAWPDGNDDVSGRRTGNRGSPSTVGRGRPNSRLRPWLTSRLSAPRASGEHRHLGGPPLAGQPPDDVGEVPDEAEVAERASPR